MLPKTLHDKQDDKGTYQDDGAVYLIRDQCLEDKPPYRIFPSPQISARTTSQRSAFLEIIKMEVVDGRGRKRKNDNRITIDGHSFESVKSKGENPYQTSIDAYLEGTARTRGRELKQPPNILKFIIPGELKAYLLVALKNAGVGPSNLFPGSDGFRKELNKNHL